ncbi:MAG: hypothetical protein GX829_04025, partial [Clostridium sp.]|nr:hypothetical protein [Clostridium sp.]
LHLEIDVILDEVTEIMVKIEDNNNAILDVEEEMKLTLDKIRVAEADLALKMEEYGDRLRAMYKQGNTGILSAIMGSESFSDFIGRADTIMKVAKIDRALLDEIEVAKIKLDNQKKIHEDKINEFEQLNLVNTLDLEAVDVKKQEADVKLVELQEEEKKIEEDLSGKELSLMASGKAIVNNSNSSDSDLESAITELRNVRKQIITDSADTEVVDLIEKAKSILNERASSRQSSGMSSGTASASSSSIVNKAYQYLGVPYVWGGTSPGGFDCSGFIQYVYRAQGINLPRTSGGQASSGSYVSISNAQPGDIVYFGQSRVTHVGIYIGNNRMIHSPSPGKSVMITNMNWHLNNYKIQGARRF